MRKQLPILCALAAMFALPWFALSQADDPPTLSQTAHNYVSNLDTRAALQSELDSLTAQLRDTESAINEQAAVLRASVNETQTVRAFALNGNQVLVVVFGSDRVTVVQLE